MYNCECEEMLSKEALMQQIMEIGFSILDLALYLDTHPNDTRAISLHRDYCRRYKELTDKYQRVYGPLTIGYPCNKWRWIELPWPWQRGGGF